MVWVADMAGYEAIAAPLFPPMSVCKKNPVWLSLFNCLLASGRIIFSIFTF